MSLVEELRQMEAQVTRRLQELEPLVAEYNELRGIAERIGGEITSAPPAGATKANGSAKPRRVRRTRAASAKRTGAAKPARAANAAASSAPAAAPKPVAASKPATARAARAKPVKAAGNGARGGKRDAEIVAIVAAKPGITVAEVGKQLKVDPTGLYRVVRRLESAGQIEKSGTGLMPAGAK
jgi:hypothetical protein